MSEQIGVLLLAAGASTRLGQPKQLMELGGKTLIARAIDVAKACSCQPVIAVVGAESEKVCREIDRISRRNIGANVHIIENHTWQKGMGNSICVGLEAMQVMAPGVEAVIIMSCTQPFLSPKLLQEMVRVYRLSDKSLVVARYGNDFGTPALFSRKYFHELRTLSGDEGSKIVAMTHREEVAWVQFDKGGIELNTPEDYDRIKQMFENQ